MRLTREQIKVLMALGSARSALTELTIAKRTGLSTREVGTVLLWAVRERVVTSLNDYEYFAGSDTVLGFFTGCTAQ